MSTATSPVAAGPVRHPAHRFLEFVLWTTGVAAIGTVGYQWSQGYYAQARGSEELAELSIEPSSSRQVNATAQEGALVGRIVIPRLDFSAIIFEGTTANTLGKGVGHLRGSAQIGEESNVVLAAHRDTFFRPLQDVRAGDIINVSSAHHAERYQVVYTEIVSPDHIEVAASTDSPMLTLITCYPFSYFGSAPQRFIVRANEVWSSDF